MSRDFLKKCVNGVENNMNEFCRPGYKDGGSIGEEKTSEASNYRTAGLKDYCKAFQHGGGVPLQQKPASIKQYKYVCDQLMTEVDCIDNCCKWDFDQVNATTQSTGALATTQLPTGVCTPFLVTDKHFGDFAGTCRNVAGFEEPEVLDCLPGDQGHDTFRCDIPHQNQAAACAPLGYMLIRIEGATPHEYRVSNAAEDPCLSTVPGEPGKCDEYETLPSSETSLYHTAKENQQGLAVVYSLTKPPVSTSKGITIELTVSNPRCRFAVRKYPTSNFGDRVNAILASRSTAANQITSVVAQEKESYLKSTVEKFINSDALNNAPDVNAASSKSKKVTVSRDTYELWQAIRHRRWQQLGVDPGHFAVYVNMPNDDIDTGNDDTVAFHCEVSATVIDTDDKYYSKADFLQKVVFTATDDDDAGYGLRISRQEQKRGTPDIISQYFYDSFTKITRLTLEEGVVDTEEINSENLNRMFGVRLQTQPNSTVRLKLYITAPPHPGNVFPKTALNECPTISVRRRTADLDTGPPAKVRVKIENFVLTEWCLIDQDSEDSNPIVQIFDHNNWDKVVAFVVSLENDDWHFDPTDLTMVVEMHVEKNVELNALALPKDGANMYTRKFTELNRKQKSFTASPWWIEPAEIMVQLFDNDKKEISVDRSVVESLEAGQGAQPQRVEWRLQSRPSHTVTITYESSDPKKIKVLSQPVTIPYRKIKDGDEKYWALGHSLEFKTVDSALFDNHTQHFNIDLKIACAVNCSYDGVTKRITVAGVQYVESEGIQSAPRPEDLAIEALGERLLRVEFKRPSAQVSSKLENLKISYEVQTSTTNEFLPDNSTWSVFTRGGTLREGSGSYAVNVSLSDRLSLWHHKLYVRARLVLSVVYGVVPISHTLAGGEWSPATNEWTVVYECATESQALDVTSARPTDWTCRDCPPGAHCEQTSTLHTLVPKQGFWRVPWAPQKVGGAPTFGKCLYAHDCVGKGHKFWNVSRNTSREGCVPGTEGTICATCSAGFARSANICVKCSSSSFSLHIGIICAALLVSFFSLIIVRRRIKSFFSKYGHLWRDLNRIVIIWMSFAQISGSVPTLIQTTCTFSY
jgi:hypothetical protein